MAQLNFRGLNSQTYAKIHYFRAAHGLTLTEALERIISEWEQQKPELKANTINVTFTEIEYQEVIHEKYKDITWQDHLLTLTRLARQITEGKFIRKSTSESKNNQPNIEN